MRNFLILTLLLLSSFVANAQRSQYKTVDKITVDYTVTGTLTSTTSMSWTYPERMNLDADSVWVIVEQVSADSSTAAAPFADSITVNVAWNPLSPNGIPYQADTTTIYSYLPAENKAGFQLAYNIPTPLNRYGDLTVHVTQPYSTSQTFKFRVYILKRWAIKD
tara:strand:+ start:927 stop:1415 length:489 start_codon:yes stop_codon:yes gene_type:complete